MTGKICVFNNVSLYIPNDIISERPEFYISYNSRDTMVYGDVTTALVLTEKRNPVKFFILKGNHSKQYSEILAKKGCYSDCFAYFKRNISEKSNYSDNP